ALRLVPEVRPDVVLLEIGLPDLDGYEVASALRAELDGTCPPLIAVTGWGQDHGRRRAMEVGFSHHLVKPVSPRALKRLLVEIAASSSSTARGPAPPEDSCKEPER